MNGNCETGTETDIRVNFEDYMKSLDLRVNVRPLEGPHKGFIASITNCEFKRYPGDRFLTSHCGYGADRDAAILDFAKRISGLPMVVDALRDTRRTIQLPDFNAMTRQPHP